MCIRDRGKAIIVVLQEIADAKNISPPPSGTVTFLFSDMYGSTDLVNELGDLKFRDISRTHEGILSDAIREHDGYIVKEMGDGFMAAFASSRNAVICSMEIQKTLKALRAKEPDLPINVRIGLNTGEAILENGDYFGRAVSEAARISSKAEAEQILISSVTKRMADSAGDLKFGEEMEFETYESSGDSEESEGENSEGEDSEKEDCTAPVDSCEDGESGEECEEGKEKEGSGNSDSEGEETEKEANSGKTGGLGGMTNPIQAETVLEWENRKEDLNDDSGKDYWYANVPESNLDSIINYKDCLKDLKDWYEDGGIGRYSDRWTEEGEAKNYADAWMEAGYKYATKIEKDSMRTVNYLLKEFEMKKSADSYQRASIAKTGVLDMLKMHSYKYNEDVFKRISITPGDKNHGLVMFLDWSASMANQHHDCFKQLLQIVWFCNRAGIKFEVYAFTDSGWDILGKEDNHSRRMSENPKDSPTWNFKRHDVLLGNHLLFNIFSDRMSKQELKKMVHYLTMTTLSISANRGYGRNWEDGWRNEITEYLPEEHLDYARYNSVLPIPDAWHLGGTPLNGAIVNAMKFIPMYRNKNNIQKLNIVFITDGASNDSSNRRMGDDGMSEYPNGKEKVVYSDPVTRKSYNRVEYRSYNQRTTSLLLKMLKDRVKCNVVGFFLAASGNGRVSNHDLMYVFPNQDLKMLRKILR